MLTCEYYQNYKGPLLVSASLNNVDITEKLKGIYGVKEVVPSIILVEDLSRNKN